ncbi:MAG: T9SS type A sorting domain-containing protein, partial [Bacteroidia bacterium]
VTPPAGMSSSGASQTNVSCSGGSNGAATVNVTGGTPGYTYSWAPSGGTAATAGGLTAATYTCTITDANNCTSTQTVSVTQPAAILSSLSSGSNISCFNANDGSASVIASGGTGTLSYSWTPSGGNAAAASGLSAGIYTCTISDQNGCTATQTTTIIEPDELMTSLLSQTIPTCFGGNDGSITLNTTGGTGTIAYTWTPFGGNNATANNLTAGTYTVTVNDANNCQITETLTLTQPGAIASSQTVTLCAGQTITVGVNTYSVTGVYTDVLNSMNSCDSTVTTNLTVEAPIDVTIQTGINIISAIQLGATYQWIDCNNNNLPIAGETGQTFSPVINGNYAVIITVGSCSDTSVCSTFTTGIEDNSSNSFAVYPNPNNGQFIVELTSSGTVSIVDVTGREVFVQQMIAGRNTVDLSNQSNGVYLMRIANNGQQAVQRIIIQH